MNALSSPRRSKILSLGRRLKSWGRCLLPVVLAMAGYPESVSANQPGGIIPGSPNVTVVDDGDGTVTMSNGIATIIINKTDARLASIKYTYNNNGTSRTTETLAPSNGPGRETFYFGGYPLGNGTYVYSLATNPASNGGDYGDVKLLSDSSTNGVMEAHYSMLRGSPGFYVTSINTHRSTDAAGSFGVFGINSDVAALFNWVSADPARNYSFTRDPDEPARPPSSPETPTASHEMVTDLYGGFAGQFDDKFITAQDRADEKAFGWSSVGADGNNVGVWQMTNLEYGNGGPLKRDVGAAPNTELSNSIMTGEFNMGSDGSLSAVETFSKTSGPFFVYLNNVSSSITDAIQAAQALFNDATAQDAAEKGAWPYAWFNNPNYAPASGRGTVTGKIQISDPLGNFNPAVAGTWVGLESQPQTSTGTYDFQKWLKPYQFWAQTDSGGNFTIPDVIAGTNYTLYAFGPGIAGTFTSQHQTAMPGGSPVDPPLEVDVPSPSFNVSVTAGQTTTVPTFKWTAKRTGPTVFELGYPDRKADKYRHGEDFWAPQTPPKKVGYPTGIWGGQMYFSSEYANPLNEVDYTAGTSRWATDWNYVLPSQQAPTSSKQATYQDATGVITFNLANAPGANDQASLYIAFAGDGGGKIIVKVNGTTLDSSLAGVTAAPNPISSTGFNPPTTGSAYQDDSSVHCSDHGPFFDERINFPASLLTAGTNKLTIINDAKSFAGFLMVDYLRLEMTNYVPPPPATVHEYPGNNRNLITWPVVPGATRYALLRSTSPDSGYTTLVPGILGTVSGSGPGVMSYTDTTALNNTNYYYMVESLNTNGSSAPSVRSGRATPSSSLPTSVPASPVWLVVNNVGDGTVALTWSAGADAAYCNLYRTTLHSDGLGGTYPLRTILLQDALTGRSGSYSCTDTTPTNGTTYSYDVKAVSAAGTSGASDAVTATPLPPTPAFAPPGLAATRTSGTSVDLSWQSVPNATGYTIYRATAPGGPFAFPANFVNVTPLLGYTDGGRTAGAAYYYQVTAVNAAGVSSPASVTAAP